MSTIRSVSLHFARPCAVVLFALATASAATGATTYKQPSFHESIAFSGLTNPTTVRFLPDGRVLVAEKSGLIQMFDSLTDTTPTVVADLRTEVYNYWDRGLLGMAVPPNFDPNSSDTWRRYIYILYTYDALIGGVAPKWGTPGQTSDPCPSPPGPTTDGCVVSGRLSRLLATGPDWGPSEQVLIEDWCQQFPSHSIGALGFGADEKLYVSGGEGSSFTSLDYGNLGGTSGQPPPTPKNPCGDPPVPVGGNQTPPGAEGGALRSQSPQRTAGQPFTLNGSVLRVDPSTGAGVSGNPLFGSSDANARRIIGYGLRNPFRTILKPGTNDVWIADVGWSDWEEINRITDFNTLKNFGWPCFEGNGQQIAYAGMSPRLTICSNLYQSNAVVAPFFTYNHNDSVVGGDGCLVGSSSVAGMAFYQGGSNYPAAYNGALFFSDYSRACLWVMFPGAGGQPDPANRAAFAASAQGPVDLQIGPDGNLYYPDFDHGNIWRIEYGPVAKATGNPTSGSAPLTVNFSSAGSAPAQTGDTITFAWDLDGDGQYNDSTAANPSWTYTITGGYTARLKVTDNHGASNISSPIAISVGNTPPTATIATPASTLTWKVGDVINFSGSATDPEQGTLPASALGWQIIIHHCPSTCHTHLIQTFTGVASGSFAAPDHEYYSYLEIALTATDAGGLTNTASVNLNPQTVDLSFATVPTGLQLTVGSTGSTAPFTRTVIIGSLNSISAPPQGNYQFSSWSDGGAATHNVTAGSTPVTYTATFTSSGGGLPAPWSDQDIGSVGAAGSASYAGGTFTVVGSGSDIWDNADEFHYVDQSISGDSTVIARVASLQNTDAWAKGGVMIRESLTADSRFAMMVVTPGNGLAFQRRTATGAAAVTTTGLVAAAPYWVKIVRSGNTFSGYTSPDNITWTLVGSDTITMSASAYAGLAVTSHNDGVLCTGVFDNVSATGGSSNNPPSATITSPANGAAFTAPATITIQATASDTDGTVSKVDFYQNGNFLGTDATSPYSFAWSGVGAGAYSLTAIATDNSGGTGTSPPIGVTVTGGNANPTATITSPANGAIFTAPATVTIQATASDTDGTVSKVDFYQNGNFLGTDATSPYSFTWSSVAAGGYSLTAVATDNVGGTGTSPPISITVNPAGGGLPAPWVQQDIGAVGAAGSATYAGGVFTVNGSGADIESSSDEFHYVYQPLSGNGTIIARVASIQNTDPWAKGGVMIRATLNANSKHAMMVLTPGNGLAFQRRTATGGSTAHTPGALVTAPYWVKLVRNGNVFSGYSSPDNITWTLVGSATISMPTGVFMGLPLTSHNDGIICTALFDNVSVTGGGTNNPPSATITSPANGATFTAPATVTIQATASDTDGTVSKVDFYQNGNFLGTDATSPYSFTWSSVAAGSYSLTAVATDNLGGTGTSPPIAITVTSANANPTATITSPANGATFTAPATITIQATASDTDGTVSKVDFYRNGIFIGTDATSPYSFTWSNVAAGSYSLTAVATDNLGGTGTSPPIAITVSNPNANPTATITSPANGATFTAPATITIQATASDTDGTVSKVDFYQNGNFLGTDATSPYSFTWSSVAAGSYSLTAVATDNLGGTGTSPPIAITVSNPNANPTATITSPANGATFTAPATITIQATASDTDGTVTKVDFYQNGNFLGTDATSPYSFTWSNVAAGSYSLTAVATDNLGGTGTSPPISITVNPAGGGLPAPWVQQDIGAVGAAGSATYSAGAFSVVGSGDDIWNNADAFHYVYQPLTGNGTIIARVGSVQNTSSWAKAGVMIRESLAPNSRFAMMDITPANGITFQRRTTTGAAAVSTQGPIVVAPYWLKLVRSTNTFSGYYSTNGTSWTLLGTVTIALTNGTFIGLPVTSHNVGILCTAVFDNVSVTSP